MSGKSLSQFRIVALLEGISFLVLIFIAMPLKYIMQMPLMVKYTGWAHGVLFIAYFVLLVLVWQDRKWALGKVFWAALASFVPFGTFLLDAKILKPEAQQPE